MQVGDLANLDALDDVAVAAEYELEVIGVEQFPEGMQVTDDGFAVEVKVRPPPPDAKWSRMECA